VLSTAETNTFSTKLTGLGSLLRVISVSPNHKTAGWTVVDLLASVWLGANFIGPCKDLLEFFLVLKCWVCEWNLSGEDLA